MAPRRLCGGCKCMVCSPIQILIDACLLRLMIRTTSVLYSANTILSSFSQDLFSKIASSVRISIPLVYYATIITPMTDPGGNPQAVPFSLGSTSQSYFFFLFGILVLFCYIGISCISFSGLIPEYLLLFL